MMKRSGKLNQALQEDLFPFGLLQPQFLPDLVSLEEVVRVKKRNATLKRLTFSHSAPIRCTLEFHFGPATLVPKEWVS